MRITQRQLRQMIREAIAHDLNEMPYAGSLGVQRGSVPEPEEGLGSINIPGAERLARSDKFQKTAQKLYANVPFPVWLAPMIGQGAGVGVGTTRLPRLVIQDLVPDGIRTLTDLGYDIPSSLSSDDLVILYNTSRTNRTIIASPWMIFHAIFDSDPYVVEQLCPSFINISLMLANDELPEDVPREVVRNLSATLRPLTDRSNMWGNKALTMGSARRGEAISPPDNFNEMICQDLLTQRGLRINYDNVDEETAQAIRVTAEAAHQVADEFRQNAHGKLLIIAVN